MAKRYFINDDEEKELRYATHEARTLYRDLLRQKMDYGSGIVGFSAAISYKAISETLEVHPGRGSKRGNWIPKKSECIARLRELERRGLISPLVRPKSGRRMPLVFRLPKADYDAKKFCLGEEQHLNNTEAKRSSIKGEFIKIIMKSDGYIQNLDAYWQVIHKGENARTSEEQHTSVIRNNNIQNITEIAASLEKQIKQADGENVYGRIAEKMEDYFHGENKPLPIDWLPHADAVQHLVGEGVDVARVAGVFFEWRVYWRDRKEARDDWNRVFVSYVLGGAKPATVAQFKKPV